MRVLRENKDSAMAMLEAFVHDPLINWRLLAPPSPRAAPRGSTHAGIGLSAEELDSVVGSTPRSRHGGEARTGDDTEMGDGQKEMLNEKAVEVITRVESKLRGTDFGDGILKVESQVRATLEFFFFKGHILFVCVCVYVYVWPPFIRVNIFFLLLII